MSINIRRRRSRVQNKHIIIRNKQFLTEIRREIENARERESESKMKNCKNNVVYVGNIPFQASEKEVIKVCEDIGPVISFKLITDKDSGKPKGYGFCEYGDEETARSAVRNMNGSWIRGRQLRVNLPSKNTCTTSRVSVDPSVSSSSSIATGGVVREISNSTNSSDDHEKGVVAASTSSSSPYYPSKLAVHMASTYTIHQLWEFLSEITFPSDESIQAAYSLCPQLPKALLHAIMMHAGVDPITFQVSDQPSVQSPPPTKRRRLEDGSTQVAVS